MTTILVTGTTQGTIDTAFDRFGEARVLPEAGGYALRIIDLEPLEVTEASVLFRGLECGVDTLDE